MTGFAAVQRELPHTVLLLELRSVNSRFLDLVFKIPDELRLYEPALRERLAGAIKRGKLECRIAFQRRVGNDRQAQLDESLLTGLAAAARRVQALVPEAAPMSVADLLRWPGVLGEDRLDPRTLPATLDAMGTDALGDFVASRQREGQRLGDVMLARVADIERILDDLEAFIPGQLQQYEDKLTERLKAALTDAASGTGVPAEETFHRLRQEITLHGMRIDVSEELARLRTHAHEVRRVIQGGGTIGKRLDFLMQELNREANTLGSKATARELTSAAMELKLLIEQIREQSQNIE